MQWTNLFVCAAFNWPRGLEPLGHHTSAAAAQCVRGSVKHYPQDGKPAGEQRTGATRGCSLCLPNRNSRGSVPKKGEDEGVKESINILELLPYLQGPCCAWVFVCVCVCVCVCMCVCKREISWSWKNILHHPSQLAQNRASFFVF